MRFYCAGWYGPRVESVKVGVNEKRQVTRGLDNTHTWGRTYWGGALFCLLADMEIYRRTHNRKGLEDALRGILLAGGNITQDWELEKALSPGDRATGVPVLLELYEKMKDKPVVVDLDALWTQLGIERQDNRAVFDDLAPLAAVRKAITFGETPPSSAPAANLRPSAFIVGRRSLRSICLSPVNLKRPVTHRHSCKQAHTIESARVSVTLLQ